VFRQAALTKMIPGLVFGDRLCLVSTTRTPVAFPFFSS